MIIEVKVPVLAESVTDATVLAWEKKPGDTVQRGDHLVDLETDKVTLEVTAPENGVLKEILKDEGSTVLSEEVLARIDTEAAASGDSADKEPQPPTTAPLKEQADAPREEAGTGASEPKVGPAVRKLLAEHGLDASQVPATGKDGRLTKADVQNYLRQQQPAAESAQPAAPQETGTAAPSAPAASTRTEERVPMTRLRKRAAERLLAAQHENAILTTFNEIDMQPVMDLRKRYREQFEARHGVKLGFMSFFARAVVEGLRRFPIINASVDGDDIIYHGYYDLGVAVSTERGLVVPVVRDADLLSFAEFEKALNDLGQRAREGKLGIEELTGGTFTITNGGVFGSLLSTPIINPPQSAILGMHKIQPRPVAVEGEVVIRPMMYVALSYDHRIIDGSDAVRFLVTVKEQLEDPGRMLLEI